MKLKTSLSVLAISLLVGCSSAPKEFIFSPNYTLSHQTVLSKQISLTVNDKRNNTITVSVKDDDSTQTFNNNNLVQSITPAIEQALTQIGVKNSGNSQPVTINIDLLNSTVEQALHKHSISTQAELEVVIENTQQRFTKRYKGTRQSEAPLAYDKAEVEKQVNRLVEELITRIVTDPEFIDALTR
jgi:uncharacterized lipoprotein